MLNKVERKIMDYVFAKCRGKKTVLMTPKEILQSLLPKHELTAKQLDIAMKNLSLDGYADVQNSDEKGSLVYVVTLKTRGEAYQRERDDLRKEAIRSLSWKLALAAAGAVVTFIVVAILNSIFK